MMKKKIKITTKNRIIKSVIAMLLVVCMLINYMPSDLRVAYAKQMVYGVEMDELELVGKRDLAVYAAQKWVNKTYKGKAGYEKTDEDGAIGNGTVSSLVRALQIELGISEVDGAYGKGTQAKVPTLSKGCESKDNISTNLIRILQYGLYCKGYGTDHEVDGKFGKGTEDAIKRIQEDIGIKSTGEVNGLLFRAILNTDGYVLDKNEGDNNVRKFQKIINKHYSTKLDNGIASTNGIFDRNNANGLMCMLQDAVGVAIDGQYGNTTLNACPEKVDTLTASDSKETGIIHVIQYSLYANGYNKEAKFDGKYSSYIKEQVEKFQKFMCLSVDKGYGVVDKITVASLVTSCGYSKRKANACDMIHKLTATEASNLAKDGYRYVGRYIMNVPGGKLDKVTSVQEMKNIIGAGMAVVPLFQMNGRKVSEYSTKNACVHAINATAAAISLQIPYNSTIYFAVDYDATKDDIRDYILPYFKALHNRMKAIGKYKVGIYGTRHVASKVCDAGYASTSYISNMSRKFSGNMGFKMPSKWAFDQFTELYENEGPNGEFKGRVSPYGFGIDKVTASGRDKGVTYLEVHNKKKDWKPVVNEAAKMSMYWADPIDLATGAFCVDFDAMSVTGATQMDLALSYSSEGLAEGVLGAGWYHTYEKKLEKTETGIRVFTTPSSYIEFAPAQDKENTYICTAIGRLNDVLTVEEDGTFYLNCNNNMEYWFDTEGRLTSEKSSTGFYTDVEYTDNSIKIVDRLSKAYILLEKNADKKVTKITDKQGRVCSVEYGEKGYVSSITDVNGNKTSYTYDEVGKIISAKDNDGVCYVQNEYDNLGRVVKQYDAEDRKGVTTLTYDDTATDGSKNVTVVDRNGKSKNYIYSKEGYILSEIDQNGNTTIYEYDEYGNQTAIKDALGNADKKTYSNYRLESETDKLGAKTLYEYNEKGKPVKITYSNGKSVTNKYDSDNRIVKSTDLRGKEIEYTYDEDGVLLSIKEGKRETKYTYENGRIKTETDANGNTKTFEYNEAGQLVSTTDACGVVVKQNLNGKGKALEIIDSQNITNKTTFNCRDLVQTVTDGNGNVYTNVYDGNGNHVATINPNGTKKTFEYDGEDRLIKSTDEKGNVKTIEYDSAGGIISETDTGNNKKLYEYDKVGNIIKEIDPDGNEKTFTYNANGDILTETDANGNTTTYVYNSDSKLEKIIDPQGGEIKKIYNDAFDVVEEVNALGKSTKYEYDIYGNLTKKILPNGNSTTYEYDNVGNLTKEINSLGEETTYVYDKCNRLIETIDANGNSIKTEYDASGRKIATIDGNGNRTTYEYNANGNNTVVKDSKENTVVTNEYDVMNKVTSTVDANGTKKIYTYDANNNLVSETDGNENTKTYAYDASNRIVAVTDALGNSSKNNYTNSGKVTSMVGALGGITAYEYDKVGNIISETTTSGGKISYTYNALSLINEMINGRGDKTSYKYDVAGRIIENSSKDGTTKYTYDDNGNVLVVENEQGKITRQYDKLDRVISYTDTKGKTIKYSYDKVGNLKEITYPDDTVVKYEYDKANNLTKVTDWNNNSTTYEYDENNRLAKTKNTNGSVSTRIYDNAGQLISIEDVDKDGKGINKYTYEYDKAGNVIKETSDAENLQYVMTYDKLNRVTSRIKKNILTGEENGEYYTYDAAGNITEYKNDENAKTLTYSENNKLNKSNDVTFTYDMDGNMTETSMTEINKLSFNVENKLVSAGNNQYIYDAEGSRIERKDDKSTTNYVYDIKNSQLLMSYDESGNITKYVYGNGLIGQENKDGYRNYHFDLRGSTTALTDDKGVVTSTYSYTTFGDVKADTVETEFMYNGRDGVIKDNNGLLYMRARYYMPQMMRFVSADKVKGTVMEPLTLNRYAYVEGNPITKVDPSGYSSQPGSVGAQLKKVGYKNRVVSYDMFGEFGESGFIINKIGAMPVTGLQFSGAHKVCAIGGVIPVIGAGFDIIDASLYGLEGDKMMQTAAISGAALNLFGSKWLFSGASSSLDNFAEAGIKYTDDAVEAGIKGRTFEGKVYRNVKNDPVTGKPYNPLEMNKFTIDSEHRYTKEGVPGLYFGDSIDTLEAELRNYKVKDINDGRTTFAYTMKADNMLDLTDVNVRRQLGINLSEITGDSYSVTHTIGDMAYANGYNGLIVPSARLESGVNVVIFNPNNVSIR